MKYPHRITIQSTQTTKTATGVPNDDPVAIYSDIYARVAVITGREKWVPEGSAQSNDATIYLRYRDDVNEKLQVKHGSDTYEITAAIPDERKRELRLICKRFER